VTDATFSNLTVRRNTASVPGDLLTLDSIASGNRAALGLADNSDAVPDSSLVLGRISAQRLDSSTIRLDLAVAADPSLSTGDAVAPLLSLVNDASGLHITTSAPLTVSAALSVSGMSSLNGGLSVTGNIAVTGRVDGRDVSADGARLDQHLADSANPHNTTAAQIDALPTAGGTITGGLTVQGDVGIGATTPGAKLDVAGVVRAVTFESTTELRHRMYPAGPIIHQDIFDAKARGAITKLGNPQYDETAYSVNLWFERRLIKFGTNNEADGNGAQVRIPDGYDTVWVRVLGDRWTAIHAYFLDGQKEDLGLWAGGYRAANCYCPDGTLSDGCIFIRDNGNRTGHQWLPIPARRAGSLALIAKPNTVEEFWLSGLAFSKNPWAHAAQSAVTYSWALNGGDAVRWNNHDWNNDVLAELGAKTNWELKVPVIPSGRDKLLYLVEHNNNWNGCLHTGITVNNQPIERFMATYDNPFARHWNSKFYERYIAARIPADFIPAGARWLSIRVDMSRQQTNSIYFREIGTHDMDIPWS